MGKIISLDELVPILDSLRQRKKIVLCHGVFDLLHIGHIRYFKNAKAAGDILIVTVTPDHFVNKGPNRPVFPELLRAEAIAALEEVDYVAINQWPTAVETIRILQPHIYVKGSEYRNHADDVTGMIEKEVQAIQHVGGTILYTDDIVFSSSSLINEHLSIYSQEVQSFLHSFRKTYDVKAIDKYFKSAKKLKILIIGEVILDEYWFCDLIGIASKDPIISFKYKYQEKYAGGILAVANHISDFVDSVDLLCLVGEFETQEDFIRSQLRSNIQAEFIYKKNSPTIVKRRFVIENQIIQKLFEVHHINDSPLEGDQEDEFINKLKDKIQTYDLVLTVDFGHGFISKKSAEMISSHATFLALNVQTNSGNRGFNVVSKFPHADFICLNNLEIQMEERDAKGGIEQMLANVGKKASSELILVTQGKEGNIILSSSEEYIRTPALAHKVIDRIGSGDALISIAALFAVQKAPPEMIGFIGNVVAAQAVSTVGHRSSVEYSPLIKYITTLLK